MYYPKKEESKMIYDGFKYGFYINYNGPRHPFDSKIFKSVLSNPEGARLKIESEIIAGRIVGPFDTRPISNLRFSPIGLIQKKTGGTGVSKWAGTQYFYPPEIVHSTGRNY
jgi:hypothetical protein